jgi:hypothetical protein
MDLLRADRLRRRRRRRRLCDQIAELADVRRHALLVVGDAGAVGDQLAQRGAVAERQAAVASQPRRHPWVHPQRLLEAHIVRELRADLEQSPEVGVQLLELRDQLGVGHQHQLQVQRDRVDPHRVALIALLVRLDRSRQQAPLQVLVHPLALDQRVGVDN